MRRKLYVLFVFQMILPTKNQLQKRVSHVPSEDNMHDYQMWRDDNKDLSDFYESDNDSCLTTNCYNVCNLCLLCAAFCLGPLIHKIQGR